MNVTVLGSAPHLPWLAARLAAQGWHVRQADAPVAGIADGALLAGQQLLDCGARTLGERHALAADCRAQGLDYAECAGHWLPPGVQYGFALYVGCDRAQRRRFAPLLDALAPRRAAWLHCGPSGAGWYAAHVVDALSAACALAMQAGWSTPGGTLHTPDWQAFFAGQAQLADRLLALSQRYLALCPAPAADRDDPWQSLAAFRRPPAEQDHFAGNLARLVVLALGQGIELQRIFETLAARAAATPRQD